MNICIGFNSCLITLNKWCLQSGTNQQYTTCDRASEDGRTCYNPQIKYGYLHAYSYNHNSYYGKTGGYPVNNGNNDYGGYKQWCQQLFPKKTIISSSVTFFSTNWKPSNFVGGLFWCSTYDENRPHWCDLKDGYWYNYNQPLGPYYYNGLQIVSSLTCQY